MDNKNESAQIGTLLKFRYSPGYSDMNGASHQTELARNDEGKWIITDRNRDDIADPAIVTTWSADDEAVSEFIRFLAESDFLSLANRPESNSFMDDYSPWGYFIMFDNSSIGGGKRDHYNIGQYKEYSDVDYELIKTIQKRFEELKGNKLSETIENE